MCGISVAIQIDGAADEGLIRAMCDAIRHRGPDSDGYHLEGRAAIGMRRLRVIDLDSGDQPIYNDDRSLVIVFNGEIYNYRELRDRLVKRGHRFRTESDTEVVLRLYEEMGADAVKELNGMFGFAILETQSGRVFIARDRLGIKPLYYARTARGIYAASEIKSLLCAPDVDRSIDYTALDQYFSLLYIPSPRSIFRGVRKLPPGHTLVVEPDGTVVVDRYWKLQSNPHNHRSEADLIDEFRQRFDEAVSRQLVADVPLGVFLSGGIDSGAMVASMARSGASVRSLSLGFASQYHHFDEREQAALIARRYGTTHEELIVDPDLDTTLETFATTFDEPLADHGAIPNYLICKAAREKVTVALSGLGGDELSGGYQRHLGMLLASNYRRVPEFIREKILRRIVDMLPEPEGGGRSIDRAKRFMRHAALPGVERYYAFSNPLSTDGRQSLYADGVAGQIEIDSAMGVMKQYFDEQSETDFLNKILAVDIQTYMVDDLLAVADRTSMASSLEVRVPYLDHTLVEFMANVPGRFKIQGMNKKAFLKKAFQDDLPAEIISKRKTGFTLPVVRWLREELRPMLEDSLSEDRIRRDGFFDPQFVTRLKDEHLSLKHDRSNILWALLMFNTWSEKYGS